MLSHSAGMHNTDISIAGICPNKFERAKGSKRFHFASLHYIFSAYLPTHIKFLTEFHRIFLGTTCISLPLLICLVGGGKRNIRLNLVRGLNRMFFVVSIFFARVCGGEGYSSGANIGSQAGSLIGFCLRSFATLSGTYFLLSTKRNMYSLNHSSVMM